MKTLALTLIILTGVTFNTIAQDTFLKTNQIAITTDIDDGITVVRWESLREVNTAYFLIEKSTDGENYTTIHTQKASGSTHKTVKYTYEDLDVDTTEVQYRITLVCMDGVRIAAVSEPIGHANMVLTSQD